MATNTPAKTTNCRICQPFGDAYEEKAGREPTQGQQRKLKLSISRKANLQSTGG